MSGLRDTTLGNVADIPIPLTPEQRDAIRRCRFSYTTQSRDHAWLIFDDPEIIKILAGVVRRTETYTRDHVTKITEHEALIAHPEAVALVLEIMAEREK